MAVGRLRDTWKAAWAPHDVSCEGDGLIGRASERDHSLCRPGQSVTEQQQAPGRGSVKQQTNTQRRVIGGSAAGSSS